MIYATIGLPRSGKSTITKSLRTQMVDTCYVSGDAIRLALTGERYNSKIEDFVHTLKYHMIKTALVSGQNVIYDGTNTTMESINNILHAGWEAGVIWIFVDTPKDVCIDRAKLTGQPDLIPIIERMSIELQTTIEKMKKTRNVHYVQSLNLDRITEVDAGSLYIIKG